MPDDISISYDELLKRYFRICNRAMQAKADEFPFDAMFTAMAEQLRSAPVAVAVYDDMPKASGAVYLEGEDLSLSSFEDERDGPVVRVPLSQVMMVVQNPERYIDDPTLIDWSWANRKG